MEKDVAEDIPTEARDVPLPLGEDKQTQQRLETGSSSQATFGLFLSIMETRN